MKTYRTPIAAALCCMALASGSVFAQGETTGSASTHGSSAMNRSDAHGMGAGMSSTDSETVRQVQQALQAKGHNPGPIDGVMGPRTRSALQAYQRANNLSGAQGMDQQTLGSLGVQASAGAMGGGSSPRSGDSGSSAGGTGTTMGGAGGTTPRRDTESGTTRPGTPGSGGAGAQTGGGIGSAPAK